MPLLGTTWRFKDTISFSGTEVGFGGHDGGTSIDIMECMGTPYYEFSLQSRSFEYSSEESNVEVYNNDTWTNDDYRTITFIAEPIYFIPDETTANNWLRENAEIVLPNKVMDVSGGKIIYDDLRTRVDQKAPKVSPVFTGSISMGRRVNTTKGDSSIAAGFFCAAKGYASSAFGYGADANGAHQHVVGRYNEIDGPDTFEDFVPGQYNEVGKKVRAINDQTHNMEYWICKVANVDLVISQSNWDQIYAGCMYAEIVGNGDSATRSNARTLDWDGNESLAGSITLGKGTTDEVTLTAAKLKQLLALLN